METVADDYTEFNALFPTRLDGKALNSRCAEAYEKDAVKILAAERNTLNSGPTTARVFGFSGCAKFLQALVSLASDRA